METAELRVQLLGGFRMWVGQLLVAHSVWRRGKAMGLIKLLALAPGHRLARADVLRLLWPELESATADNNLHNALHSLRQILEPHRGRRSRSAYVSLNGETLQLHAMDGVWVDVQAFKLACVIAQHARQPEAYEAALALYRGELLPEDRYEDWAAADRERLHGLYLDVLLELAELYERAQEPWAAIRTLERLVTSDPTHESASLSLIRLYAHAGQRQRALQQYRHLDAALRRELDVEPDAAARRLHADIINGRFPVPDPSGTLGVGAPSASTQGTLSAREAEIAQLVERGLTNKQIGEVLGLSARTAEVHVGRILRKLGLASRSHLRITT